MVPPFPRDRRRRGRCGAGVLEGGAVVPPFPRSSRFPVPLCPRSSGTRPGLGCGRRCTARPGIAVTDGGPYGQAAASEFESARCEMRRRTVARSAAGLFIA